jgi:hypothetical protein
MPYIKDDQRVTLDITEIKNSGELTYLLTKVCMTYLKDKDKSFYTLNQVIGALENSKMEFYRRVLVPYENGKLSENGDVYD